MKRIVFFLFAAALIALTGVLWAQRARTDGASQPRFKTAPVQFGDVAQRVTASGTLSALTTVAVGSQVSGNITRLHADYNDIVTAGQLIAEIEPSTYQARLFQAEADLLSAQATLELKQLNARRTAELLAKALVSQSDHDQAAVELRQQEAQTRKCEAAVQNARVDLERCKITSPIDGVVLSRSVDAGQTVQASFSAPTLFTLAQDLRQMQITANVSEADVGNVAAGQSAAFTVDAFPGRSFNGTVREVRNNSTTTSNVVTYPTIIVVDNSELKLRPGMTANVTITTAQRTHVLRVPNAALRFRAPANAVIRPAAVAASKAGTGATAAQGATPPSEDSPGGPGGAPGGLPPEPDPDQMPAELRTRILADFDRNRDGTLDANEKTAMRETMHAHFASGEPPPMPRGSGNGAPPQPRRRASESDTDAAPAQARTLYVLADDAAGTGAGELVATPVQIGLADTTHTEIVSGIAAGATIVIGNRSASATVAAPEAVANGTNNPFSPPRPPAGGPPPR